MSQASEDEVLGTVAVLPAAAHTLPPMPVSVCEEKSTVAVLPAAAPSTFTTAHVETSYQSPHVSEQPLRCTASLSPSALKDLPVVAKEMALSVAQVATQSQSAQV